MVTPRCPADAARRAIRLALVLTDNDGVLTDGTVYVGPTGEQLKVYSVRDGMGVERLRERGIAAGVLTRELPELIAPRAAKLGLKLWAGVRDKLVGVFSMRTPVRPNPIAAAVVEIFALRDGELDVVGLDCLDGTPLLDIKRARFYQGSEAAGGLS